MMNYILEEKYKLIEEELINSNDKNPINIAKNIMNKDYINMHGPEHHFLDGGAFLTAYYNCGGDINLNDALASLKERSIKMPGAMCGNWGVCGAVTSIGAALSIINKTTPLSNDEHYKNNMQFTSSVINKMSLIGGPRCCKRNALISLSNAVKFVKDKYNIEMDITEINCDFNSKNSQCIGIRCPFYGG